MAVEFSTIVWLMSPYKAEKLIVHLACADWADLNGEFYPTHREISRKARISKTGAVNIIAAMVKDGEIEIIQNGGHGRGSRNRYRFAEKYRAAVAELIEKWEAKRAERVKLADTKKRVKLADTKKRVKLADTKKRVKLADTFSSKRVNEDAKKGQPERAHIRNKPSCSMPVMHESVMQQQAKPSKKAAAAAKSSNESTLSRFPFPEIRKYCESVKKHARNPAGLARYLYRTGEEDEEIAAWLEQEREKAKKLPAPVEDLFDMDAWVTSLIDRNDLAQLTNELAGINDRGGPSHDWERRVVAYFNDQAATAAK